MRLLNYTVGLCIVFLPTLCLAQPPGHPTSPSTDNVQKAFNKYLSNTSNLKNQQNSLEKISAHGLIASKENIAAVRVLLAKRISDPEKISAIRILAGTYTANDRFGMNESILRDIRGQIQSNKAEIGRAATFAYSRIHYFADTDDVLLYAKNRQLISEDQYFGELAHHVRYAPPSNQISILKKIASSKNPYGLEVLTSYLQAPNILKQFTPESKKMLRTFLAESAPRFPDAIGEFGMFDAFRYENWLQSMTNLAVELDGANHDEFILNQLDSEKTDPRQILAFLVSEKGEVLISSVRNAKRFDRAYSRILTYSESFPSNTMVRELVADVEKSLKAHKGS